MFENIVGYLRRHHIGLLALVIALSGTAYAAGKIGPRDIARNAVQSRHIGKNQVTGADVNERSLKPTCPTGFTLAGRDVCFGPEHPGEFPDPAAAICAEKGLRLSDYAETLLILKRLHPDSRLILWTSDHTGFTQGGYPSVQLVTKEPTGEVSTRSQDEGTHEPFRCVTEAR